jgi:hypothetical protein
MPCGGATFDENIPPNKGGDAKRQGVVRSAFGAPQHNPLKASRPLSFRLLFPFGKGVR